MGEEVGLPPWAPPHGGSIPTVLSFFCFGAPFFLPLFVWRRVVSQPSTARTWHNRHYTAERRIIYLACIYTYRLLLPLLLFVIVCRMAKIAAGSMNLIPSSVVFLFIQTRSIFNVRTPWQYCRVHGLDLLNTYSVIMGMRGAKTGVSPPRRSHHCTSYDIRTILACVNMSTGHHRLSVPKIHHTHPRTHEHEGKRPSEGTIELGLHRFCSIFM